MFWSYLEVKKECSEGLKIAILAFLLFLQWNCRNGNGKKALRTVYIKNCPREQFKKCFWSYLKAKHECSDLLKVVFLFFCKFLSGKVEIIFWKINTKALRLFRSDICHWKYFKKRFSKLPWDEKRMFWEL